MTVPREGGTPMNADEQLLLPLVPLPRRTYDSLTERWVAWHRLNPHVLDAILRVARDLRRRGFKRGSIWLVYNRLRWLYALQTSGDEYKLNNSFAAYYARLTMRVDPGLAGFFALRRQRDEHLDVLLDDLAREHRCR